MNEVASVEHVQLVQARLPGVVYCALGWACWKTHGAAGGGQVRGMAMSVLGSGLAAARHHEDALSVEEAKLSMMRRIGASEATCSTYRAILR